MGLKDLARKGKKLQSKPADMIIMDEPETLPEHVEVGAPQYDRFICDQFHIPHPAALPPLTPAYISEPLYHQGTKGETRIWRVWSVYDNIVTVHGVLGGKLQTAIKKAEAVNVGKANERDADAQAAFEAEAMFTHKLERKYRRTVEETKADLPLPMLAHKFSAKKAQFPCHIQPKLDGVRCVAVAEEHPDEPDRVVVSLISRSGKPYNVPHIQEYLESCMSADEWIDGEIYIHGMSRQNIISLVKNPAKAERAALQLWAYDMPRLVGGESDKWSIRLDHLRATLPKVYEDVAGDDANTHPVFRVETMMAHGEEQAWNMHNRYVADGYEGAMLRMFDSPYLFGGRSHGLQKLKKFLDDEFKVVGFEEGNGKMAGCVIWVCESHDDAGEFRCVMKCPYPERRAYFENGDEYVGRLLTVRYQHLSDTGVPQFPVGIDFRPEEDLS